MFNASLAPQAPTIQERLSVPNRWSNLNKTISGFGDMQAQKYQGGQQLQMAQAQQLANAQAMYMAYTGKRNPNIDAMLTSNPYGKFILPQGQPLAQSGQGQPMNNQVASTLFGVSPAQSMASSSNMPFAMGMPGGDQSSQMAPSNGSVPSSGSMSSVNPSSGPVQTSMTSEMQPYVGMVPKSITTANPAGEGIVAGAKEYATKMSGEAAGAQTGVAKDIQQLAMVKNAIKPLVENYDKVYNSKVAGNIPAGGDIYGSTLVKHADAIPRFAQGIVPPETQNAAGQFLANRNELTVKLQPMLSQQFGKDGSSRIMETLINMSKQELGDLNTPRDQFHGQITGTINSLYRIAKASQAYKEDLQASGQAAPEPEVAAQEIARRMQSQTLSSDEQKELQGLIDDTLGNKKQPSGSMNPLMNDSKQGNVSRGTKFTEGNTYVDAKGNKAMYKNGQFLEVK